MLKTHKKGGCGNARNSEIAIYSRQQLYFFLGGPLGSMHAANLPYIQGLSLGNPLKFRRLELLTIDRCPRKMMMDR